jgi:hypothetical protein
VATSKVRAPAAPTDDKDCHHHDEDDSHHHKDDDHHDEDDHHNHENDDDRHGADDDDDLAVVITAMEVDAMMRSTAGMATATSTEVLMTAVVVLATEITQSGILHGDAIAASLRCNGDQR